MTTQLYHPARHPNPEVRMAYQDGWARAKLGLPIPDRGPLTDLCKRAITYGESDARGEGCGELPG